MLLTHLANFAQVVVVSTLRELEKKSTEVIGVTGSTREANALELSNQTTLSLISAVEILNSASTAKIAVEAVTLKLDRSNQLVIGAHG